MLLRSLGEPGPLRRLAEAAWRGAIDALLPPHCLSCDAPVSVQGSQCEACWSQLSLVAAPICHCCGLPLAPDGPAVSEGGLLFCVDCLARPRPFTRARAAYVYGPGAKQLVLPLKYNDRTELAPWLAQRMAAAAPELLAECDIILPVPLHRSRLLARRYNQAALLAKRLAAISRKPWAPDWLLRPHKTPPLQDLRAGERRSVVRGAFALGARARPEGLRALLVDDVLTSGATAEACADLLLEAGAVQVDLLTIARTPPKERDRSPV
ncbi:ComF family protein [Acetobacteraceae bacterium H6797]|nr:ComF family protein [Acetobacteraceae bacterium H6797]